MLRSIATTSILVMLVACGTSDGDNNEADTGNDTGTDTALDSTVDTTPDTSDDTDPDTTTDTSPDVVTVTPPQNHRIDAITCDNVRSDTEPVIEQPEIADCMVHADCTDGDNGRCSGNPHDGYYCTYDQCFTDDDCGGGVCACGGGFRSDHNVCLGGNCQVDADCGTDGFCSPSYGSCGEYTGVTTYFCHTEEDTCLNDSDCGDGEWGPGYCRFFEDQGSWSCAYDHCAG